MKNDNWNKEMKKAVKELFNKTEYMPEFGYGWLNIKRKDGMHMEVYPCIMDKNLKCEIVTATYTIDNKETNFNVDLSIEPQMLLFYTKKILGKSIK